DDLVLGADPVRDGRVGGGVRGSARAFAGGGAVRFGFVLPSVARSRQSAGGRGGSGRICEAPSGRLAPGAPAGRASRGAELPLRRSVLRTDCPRCSPRGRAAELASRATRAALRQGAASQMLRSAVRAPTPRLRG